MSNFLDAICPKCRRTDGIDVEATVWVRICENGTDQDEADDQGHDYTPESHAECCRCGWHGTLQDFTPADENGGAA